MLFFLLFFSLPLFYPPFLLPLPVNSFFSIPVSFPDLFFFPFILLSAYMFFPFPVPSLCVPCLSFGCVFSSGSFVPFAFLSLGFLWQVAMKHFNSLLDVDAEPPVPDKDLVLLDDDQSDDSDSGLEGML